MKKLFLASAALIVENQTLKFFVNLFLKLFLMTYRVLGKQIEIRTMKKPDGSHGSVFEFTGDETLNEIGLKQKFWFKSKHGFSNIFPESLYQTEIEARKNQEQLVLTYFLEKSIFNGELTNQCGEPHI